MEKSVPKFAPGAEVGVVHDTPRKRKPSHLRHSGAFRTNGGTKRLSGTKRTKQYGGATVESDYEEADAAAIGYRVGAYSKPDHAKRAVSISEMFAEMMRPTVPLGLGSEHECGHTGGH